MGDQERNEANSTTAGEDAAVLVETSEQLAALTSERDQLLQEKVELQNQLRYRLAEFDNFRKRSERERLDTADFITMEVVRPFLATLDDFERALKAASAADAGEFAKGVELIYNRLMESLKKLGVEPIESVGKPFDPHVHEAMQRVETADADDGTVLEEYQRGYTYKGKLLRPAMVKVAVHP